MHHRFGHHIGNVLHVPGLVLNFGYELNMGSFGPCQEILSVSNKQSGMSFAGHNRVQKHPSAAQLALILINLTAYAGQYRTVNHSLMPFALKSL